MTHDLLACGPYFVPSGFFSSLVIFLLVKPLAYVAFVKAFRYRVSRVIPMTQPQVIRLALLRAGIGVVFVGGGSLFLLFVVPGQFREASWVYLYASRLVAWWVVGSFYAKLRGWRLVSWTVSGTLINVAFDVAVVAGLATGWFFPMLIVLLIAGFIAIMEGLGRRASLQARFSSEPFCADCEYNLTGNLSGICPECGTPIVAA